MAVANTLTYDDMTTITSVKSFVVQASGNAATKLFVPITVAALLVGALSIPDINAPI
jgi:hypothetical protein